MSILTQTKISSVLLFSLALFSAALAAGQASAIPASRLINPEALVKLLPSSAAEKQLMIQVGSHVLFAQAHIPRSEYIGEKSKRKWNASAAASLSDRFTAIVPSPS